MDLACDAVAFCEDRVELRTNCPNTQCIYRKDNAGEQERDESGKPERAIERRLDEECDFCAWFLPKAVVIGGLNTETIVSRRKVRVVGISAGTGLRPLFVESFKHVAIAHSGRRHVAEAHIFEGIPYMTR